jgi:hypothetical protein
MFYMNVTSPHPALAPSERFGRCTVTVLLPVWLSSTSNTTPIPHTSQHIHTGPTGRGPQLRMAVSPNRQPSIPSQSLSGAARRLEDKPVNESRNAVFRQHSKPARPNSAELVLRVFVVCDGPWPLVRIPVFPVVHHRVLILFLFRRCNLQMATSLLLSRRACQNTTGSISESLDPRTETCPGSLACR